MSFAHGLRPEFRFPNGLYTCTYIFGTAQTCDFKSDVCTTTMSCFDVMQSAKSKGTWHSLSDLDLDLRNPANISQTAKATGFELSMHIDCKEWKISSTKVGQRGHYLGHSNVSTWHHGHFHTQSCWSHFWTRWYILIKRHNVFVNSVLLTVTAPNRQSCPHTSITSRHYRCTLL